MADIKGTSANDTLYGSNASDSIYGYEGNDRLNGGDGNDSLIGYTGNDTLVGGNGNDSLNGAGVYQDSSGPQSFGDNEIDTLTGGAGNDNFKLWGGSGRAGINVYYDASAAKDYALITDFDRNADTISLTKEIGGTFSAPTKVQYSLGASPNGLPSGTGLYVDEPGKQHELIAIMQNVSPESLSLSGNYFIYS